MSPTYRGSGPAAFYSSTVPAYERQGTFNPRACHIRNTGAAISGPSLRNESLLIFTWRFARTRDTYLYGALKARSVRRRDDPFESLEGDKTRPHGHSTGTRASSSIAYLRRKSRSPRYERVSYFQRFNAFAVHRGYCSAIVSTASR